MNSPNSVILSANARFTSIAAAWSMLPKSGSQRRKVYDAILEADGLTDEEIETATGLTGNSVRPRRYELLQDGLIEASGETRKTKQGNAAIVWRARCDDSTLF
jgi:transcription initiation factor IIE alpha subunit